MFMELTRKNEICLDFRKVNREQITLTFARLFIIRSLNLPLKDTLAIEITEGRIYVKLKDENTFKRMLKKHLKYIDSDGTEHRIAVRHEVPVMLNVPNGKHEKDFIKVLRKFGYVSKIEHLRFDKDINMDIYCTIFRAYMQVRKRIPEQLWIKHKVIDVWYPGQKRKPRKPSGPRVPIEPYRWSFREYPIGLTVPASLFGSRRRIISSSLSALSSLAEPSYSTFSDSS